MITKNKMVSVSYELRTEQNGEYSKQQVQTGPWILSVDKGRL